jgi:hypothetical protein
LIYQLDSNGFSYKLKKKNKNFYLPSNIRIKSNHIIG